MLEFVNRRTMSFPHTVNTGAAMRETVTENCQDIKVNLNATGRLQIEQVGINVGLTHSLPPSWIMETKCLRSSRWTVKSLGFHAATFTYRTQVKAQWGSRDTRYSSCKALISVYASSCYSCTKWSKRHYCYSCCRQQRKLAVQQQQQGELVMYHSSLWAASCSRCLQHVHVTVDALTRAFHAVNILYVLQPWQHNMLLALISCPRVGSRPHDDSVTVQLPTVISHYICPVNGTRACQRPADFHKLSHALWW